MSEGGALTVVDQDGAIVGLDPSLPVSADDAGRLLPVVRDHLARVRRYEAFLADVLTQDMRARGATEKRVADIVYELKSDAAWRVNNEVALAVLLRDAVGRGEITELEYLSAYEQHVEHRFNHSALNVIAKRVPEVDQYRERVVGTEKLRIKSSK